MTARPSLIADGYDAIVCDIDGVLARGHTPVEGAAGVLRELRHRGVPFRLVTNNATRTGEEVAAWLSGLGLEVDPALTYDLLRRAASALHRGVRFVATNTDRTFPTEQGLLPGNGAIVAFLEAASGRAPEVGGKPHRPLFDAAAAGLGHPTRVLMLGDRLETDIDGARAVGWDTALVLTGVTRREEAEAHEPAPTYLFEDVRDLLRPVPCESPGA